MLFNSAKRVGILWSLLFVCAFAPTAMGQNTAGAFHKLLVDKAEFTESEFSTLNSGEIVVKILKAKEKRLISVFGIVRIPNAREHDIAAFRESLSQKNNKALLEGGAFTVPPGLQDIGTLKLDDRDFDDMQNCIVGDCNLKLPAAMIKKLQTDVDWNAADARTKATNVFKQFLVDYASDFLARGDQALVELADKRKPIRLIDEYRILLDGSVFIRSLAPEFDSYLRKYPGGDLPGVENRLDWSKIGSGLKPIITITHGATFAKTVEGSSSLLIVTKQLYASHYIDASLALSSMVRIGSGDSAYLIFSDISSSDALGGAFSGMAHGVVEGEALAKVTDLLQRAKVRIEAKPGVQPEATPVSEQSGSSSWMDKINLTRISGVGGFLVLIAIGVFVFRRLRR